MFTSQVLAGKIIKDCLTAHVGGGDEYVLLTPFEKEKPK